MALPVWSAALRASCGCSVPHATATRDRQTAYRPLVHISGAPSIAPKHCHHQRPVPALTLSPHHQSIQYANARFDEPIGGHAFAPAVGNRFVVSVALNQTMCTVRGAATSLTQVNRQ